MGQDGGIRGARGRRRPRAGMLLVAVGLVVAACGSRQSDAELTAAARGAPAVDTPVTSTTTSAVATTPGSVPPTAGDDRGPVTGPSGGGGGTQATDHTGAAPATCAKQLSPLKIGMVGQLSGPVGGVVKTGTQVVQAWVAATNAAGGLRCHPVEYVTADDGGDPSAHQALVRRLVEEEHVVAMVFMGAPFSGYASVSYLTQHRIPVIGSDAGGQWFYESPMYFPQMTSGNPTAKLLIAEAGSYAKAQHLTTYGQVTCLEVPICSAANRAVDAFAAQYGLHVVYKGQASVTQPDFTSVCQGARDAHAQLFMPLFDTNGIIRAIRNCKAIGFAPTFVSIGGLVNPQMVATPEAEGTLVVLQVIPPTRTDNPSLARLQSVLRRYAPGLRVDNPAVQAWVTAMLFERAAQSISEPPSSASILNGLWSLKDDDLGGITMPITFARGQLAPQTVCGWLMRIHDGKLVDVGDGKRACF